MSQPYNFLFKVIYFLIWLPYGLFAMYNAFIDDDIFMIHTLVPAVFAKFSLFVPTAYYLFTNKNLMNSLTGSQSEQLSLKTRQFVSEQDVKRKVLGE